MLLIPELLPNGLSFQRLHIEVVGFGGHDEEDHHSHVAPVDLHTQAHVTADLLGPFSLCLTLGSLLAADS